MRHLTEEEIQVYLDGPPGEVDAEIRHHLDTCKKCRRVLAGYRALYAGLADDAGFEIPLGLSRSVVSRLRLKQTRRKLKVPGDLVLVACAIVVMLIGVSVFADIRPMLDAGSAVAKPILDYSASRLQSAYSRLSENGHTPTVFIAGILILVLTGALDLVFKLKRLTIVRRQMR